MKTITKKLAAFSPLMKKRTSLRLSGVMSKSRAKQWIRHIRKSRSEWN
ncbi:MAG TPA: hypothetical protein VJK53_00040 [Candidatus Paceibacterota bacterium]